MTGRDSGGLFIAYDDVWLLDGVRTPFVDYNGPLGLVSPTDLGIKAARAVFERAKVSPGDVGSVIAGCVAQASFDAYLLPRHIGLYSGVPIDRPAILVQRVCGTGMEAIGQAADAITLKKIDLGLCVGAESMSRNPIAAYTHRGGFKMGQVEFKDFLWEALLDPAADVTMGDTAEKTAREYKITREEVDRFAELSFSRAVAAQKACFLSGEIVPVVSEEFRLEGYKSRGIQLPRGVETLAADTHIRPSTYEALAKIRPAFGGVQTGGNSSAIVDGAAAALVASGDYAKSRAGKPLARVAAVATVGVPPEIMAIGPAPAIRKLLDGVGLSLDADRSLRNQRGFRRAGDGRRARAKDRSQQAQREWRGDCDWSSAGGDGCPACRNAGARVTAFTEAIWRSIGVHWRRPRHCGASRESKLENECATRLAV